MSRRIDVELTSARPDGTWTWRAAGAREPKGEVEQALVPSGAKVGDVLRVDAEMDLDGITILAVLPPKAARKAPERLEIIGSGRSFEPVTSTLVAKRDRPRRDRPPRGDRTERPGGPAGDGDRPRRDRPPRNDGAPSGDRGPRREAREPREPRPPRERAERPSRPPVPLLPERPKPKRLKPGRAHRRALLDSVPEEQRPIAEQVLRGGIPAVRDALKEQNERLKAEGQPPIKADGVMTLAEDLLPKVRVAEWLDRAEAALADLDELDLRDLRSVVTASGDPSVARDESTRELASKLRDGLAVRQEKEHQEWLADIDAALGVGRVVRALRLSSRPPKAGVRFPPELGARLASAAGAALTSDAAPDRWGAVLEAVAYSPVRATVTPAGYPATVTDALKAQVVPIAGLVPDIARQLGVEPPPDGSPPPRPARRPVGPRKAKPATGSKPIPPPPTAAAAPGAAEGGGPTDTSGQAEAPTTADADAEAPTTPDADAAPTTADADAEAPTTPEPAEAPTTADADAKAPTTPEAAEAPTTPEADAEAPTTPDADAAAPTTADADAEAPTTADVDAEAPTTPEAAAEAEAEVEAIVALEDVRAAAETDEVDALATAVLAERDKDDVVAGTGEVIDELEAARELVVADQAEAEAVGDLERAADDERTIQDIDEAEAELIVAAGDALEALDETEAAALDRAADDEAIQAGVDAVEDDLLGEPPTA